MDGNKCLQQTLVDLEAIRAKQTIAKYSRLPQLDYMELSFIKDYENKIPENDKTIELINDYCQLTGLTPQELIDFHKANNAKLGYY